MNSFGLEINIFSKNFKVKNWFEFFLQGDTQQRFGRPIMYEFYTHDSENGNMFSTTMTFMSQCTL